MAACWEPGSVDHLYGMADLRVPQDLRSWFGNLFAAIPDFSMSVADMVAYGEKAAVRWTATGTFTGPARFEGLAPTGASVAMEGLDLLTIRDGKIAREPRVHQRHRDSRASSGRCRRWARWASARCSAP